MLFRLSNAPITFMRLMNEVLYPFIGPADLSGEMSGSNKKRNSKWEHIDSEAFPESFYDRAPPRRPREPLSPGRGSRRHGSRSKESTITWDREGNNSRISPELDERRPRHSSRSPRNGWGRSHRISKSRSRSRSRSPAHNFRREPVVNDRSRSRSGGSAQICRDFASGRCRRGSSCHFLHQDAEVYDNRRLECSPPDDWEGRRGRTGGSRYSPDDTKNNAMRNEKSAHICNDFLKGRCRRADCRYVHPDTDADVFEKGPVENVYRNRDHESRSRDTYPDRDRRSKDSYLDLDRRRRDTYPDRNHEPSKRGETLCKFFAAGNCRNGTRCRFSHQVQETFSPDRRSLDDRRGPDHKFECSQGWDGPRWSDATAVSSIPDLQGWGDEKTENKEVITVRTAGDGRSTRYSDVTTVSTIPDMKGWEEDKIENKEMSTVWTQSDGRAASHVYEADRVWDGPSWSNTTIVPNVPVVHDWGEDKNETTEVAKEVTRSRPGDDSWSHNMLDINQTWEASTTIDESQMQDSKQPSQWKMETVVPGMGLSVSRAVENISGDMEISPRDINQQGINSSTIQTPSISNIVFPAVQQDAPREVLYEKQYQAGFQEHKLFTDPFTEQNTSDKDNKPISFSGERGDGVGIRDGPSVIHNQPIQFSQEQSIYQPNHFVSKPISNINPAGQHQLSLPSHPSREDTLPLSLNSSSFQDNRVADGSHVVSLAPSVLAAGSVTAPTPVSSVQLAQLSHLTASLTQLLENRQQLSHFTSAVTSQSMSKLSDLTAPIPTVSAPMSHPNEAPVVSAQYNPVFSSSIEPKMHNLGNHLLPSVDQKTSYNETHHQGGNLNKQEAVAPNKVEESDQKAAEAKIKAPENGPSKDIGPDDGADDTKKLKDTKGIRPFKFALAEFVKELLKPAWKDGQVGKEAYKTIVKKVVDKVVETLGLQIPQTKEKIDMYLSCSKPKIEKLVQAYVGKHQKS